MKATEQIKNLLECHGKEFTATIAGVPCRGKILVESRNVYLCQDSREGSHSDTKDLFGFKYSWMVGNGSDLNLDVARVYKFQLVEEYPIIQDINSHNVLFEEILYTEEDVKLLLLNYNLDCITFGENLGTSEWFENHKKK